MSVPNAASSFNWKWYLKNLPPPDKPVKVFSAFSCGGGSTMGYKLAGFQMLGNVEIDKKINAMYVKNHHPKNNFNMDLRDFNEISKLPEDLYNLDILDGSPPCSTFSISGQREKGWGVEKRFREGQKKQRLDELFFVFIETVKKLKPKVVIAENVPGLLIGKAIDYVHDIINGFYDIGYEIQIFKLNSARMEVPQTRERLFFIANRKHYPKMHMEFNYPVIKFGEVRTSEGKAFQNVDAKYKRLLELARPEDKNIADVRRRIKVSGNGYSNSIISDGDVCPCITSGSCKFRLYDRKYLSDGDFINVQTFPQDYDFCGNSVQYVCGMSVPPVMMAHIALEVWEQWLKPESSKVVRE